MELRTQTNGTRFVKQGYDALGNGLPFFSAIYIPVDGTSINELFIVAKDVNGDIQQYDYRAGFGETYDRVIPCCSALNGIDGIKAGVWIYAPTGFEFSRLAIENGYAIIY